jgi:putative tricarboxylic transport membrane protein
MDVLGGLWHGFSVALQPANLFWCFVGCFLGTVVGILPGLGPAATIALLLPLTFKMDPAGGIIMLAGIYYGAKYGGSTTSILLNIPGESSSVVTCIDGHAMAKNGRAGPALGIAAIASFIAGSVGIVLLTVMAPPVAIFALQFSSPEYFALMCLGLALVVLLSGPSLIKGLLSLFLGLWLTSIGTDLFTAQARFIFGKSELLGGMDFVVVAIGVFAIAEVLASVDAGDKARMLPVPKGLRNLLPSWDELKQCRFAFINGSITGFIIGILPGAGAAISSFIAYGIEKAFSKHPEKFGHGAPEGVAAPEGANNADSGGALVPLLTLGIPGGGTTAIMLSALVLWGVRPGPLLMTESPDIFWGLVASMYIGNLILLVLNLPLVGIFVNLLRIPYAWLVAIILIISIIGAYSVNFSATDIAIMAVSGAVGYLLRKLGYEMAPLLLALVLGDRLEENFRLALTMSGGSYATFADHASIIVLTSALGLVLVVQGLAWALGYRKSLADQAERA